MRTPKVVAIHKEIVTAPTIDQYYYETRDKVDGLCRILDTTDDCKMIISAAPRKAWMNWSLPLPPVAMRRKASMGT